MSKHIDVDKIISYLNDEIESCGDPDVYFQPVVYGTYLGLKSSKSFIETAETADVQEVRHGMWMYCGKSSGRDHMWQCSECLRTESTKHKSDIRDYPYCHCGAKMDAKE